MVILGVISVEVVKITKQITIKLNEERFRPLVEKLNEFAGTGLAASDSELVGRCLFYCYFSIFSKTSDAGTKSGFEKLQEVAGIDSSEMILRFLQDYSKFKKGGLPALER